jgi:uroporphyrinogen-III synthase
MSLCLFTRSQPGAQGSVQAAQALGFEAIALPAAQILPTGAAVEAKGVQALLMTSAAAARHVRLTEDLLTIPVYAVGDATAATASEMGFRTVVSARGDGATLAVLAADRLKPNDGALLHLRGQEVAGDVTGMLSACGFETRSLEVYQTVDDPDFKDKFAEYVRATTGSIIIHSPAGGRRVLAAAEGLEDQLNKWAVFGLSPACLAPIESTQFGGRFSAERPEEKALLDLLSANQTP